MRNVFGRGFDSRRLHHKKINNINQLKAPVRPKLAIVPKIVPNFRHNLLIPPPIPEFPLSQATNAATMWNIAIWIVGKYYVNNVIIFM